MKSIVSLWQSSFVRLTSWAAVILEPAGRNTAPAIALAAFTELEHEHEDPLLLILAADHVIQDE